MDKKDILQQIEQDTWMMQIIETASKLDLPDWWICAGFIRSKVWDVLHDKDKRTPIADIDIIYFDPHCLDEQVEKKYEEELRTMHPGEPWSVKNQARMHQINNLPPFSSSVKGIASFPETATAVGIKTVDGCLRLTAPHGIQDLVNLTVCPSPGYERGPLHEVYKMRVAKKNWHELWPLLKYK